LLSGVGKIGRSIRSVGSGGGWTIIVPIPIGRRRGTTRVLGRLSQGVMKRPLSLMCHDE
jgi:hypothetical protein